MYEIIFLFLAGLIGGFLAGFTGVGGGIIYIVVLPFVFSKMGIEENSLAAIIVANSIFGIFVASLISVFTHARLKTIYLKESLLIAIPAVLVAMLILILYVNTPKYSYQNFNIFIIILMSLILVKYIFFQKSSAQRIERNESSIKYMVSGAISGVISSLGGVGGAITLIPLMQGWQKIDIKKAKSLSLSMILLMSASLTFYNLLTKTDYPGFVGMINFKVITPMLLGILISSSLGVKRAHYSREKSIEIVFIIFILIVWINKLFILIS